MVLVLILENYKGVLDQWYDSFEKKNGNEYLLYQATNSVIYQYCILSDSWNLTICISALKFTG